jgi:hypothetical protein
MPGGENEVKIAVMEEQIRGLREQHKVHSLETKRDIGELSKKVDNLITIMNKGKGAYAVAIVIAGAVGVAAYAIIGKVLSALMLKGH